MFFDSKDKGGDDFWNLDEFVPKKRQPDAYKRFSQKATSAVEIESDVTKRTDTIPFSDSKITVSDTKNTTADTQITRFIPPHSDSVYKKKHVISEYMPKNPFLKNIRIISEKPNDKIFVENNLFIRERRALLHRHGTECPQVSYFSFSPRYSQMSRGQLNWYLWWRENTRNGIFLKTDESYMTLYAYELVSAEESEDKHAALDMLCSLISEYSEKETHVAFRMMIRDLICDFCLLYGLSSPINRLKHLDHELLANVMIPEFILDFSEEQRMHTVEYGLSSLSLYDYKRSKYYSSETAVLFQKAINGAISAIMSNTEAFQAVFSFSSGMYGCVTAERRPFGRMINIVNRKVKIEITYYQLSNIQGILTDAVRYSENKLREHLGIKNKLHIMAVNPSVKRVIDGFFEAHYPALPTIDRRRKQAIDHENEVHEYDKFYDVPKSEISPEHALEIERDSWSTTKILTEAFSDAADSLSDEGVVNAPQLVIEPIQENIIPQATPVASSIPSSATVENDTYAQIKEAIGDIAEFIFLCKDAPLTAQRQFATSHSITIDEAVDMINETAAEVFGDIILEDSGGVYRIIEDYQDQF